MTGAEATLIAKFLSFLFYDMFYSIILAVMYIHLVVALTTLTFIKI